MLAAAAALCGAAAAGAVGQHGISVVPPHPPSRKPTAATQPPTRAPTQPTVAPTRAPTVQSYTLSALTLPLMLHVVFDSKVEDRGQFILNPPKTFDGGGLAAAATWGLAIDAIAWGGYTVHYRVPAWATAGLAKTCVTSFFNLTLQGDTVCQTTFTDCKSSLGPSILSAPDGTLWSAGLCRLVYVEHDSSQWKIAHNVMCDGPQCDTGNQDGDRFEICPCGQYDPRSCGCAQLWPTYRGEACVAFSDAFDQPLGRDCARAPFPEIPVERTFIAASLPSSGPLRYTWCIGTSESDDPCGAPQCTDGTLRANPRLPCCFYDKTVRQDCGGAKCQANGAGHEAAGLFEQLQCADSACADCEALTVFLGECSRHSGFGSVVHLQCDPLGGVVEKVYRSADCSGPSVSANNTFAAEKCLRSSGTGYDYFINHCSTWRSCSVASGPPSPPPWGPSPALAGKPAMAVVIVVLGLVGCISISVICAVHWVRRQQLLRRAAAAGAVAAGVQQPAAASVCQHPGCGIAAVFGDHCEQHAPRCAAAGCAAPFVPNEDHQESVYCPAHACRECGELGVYDSTATDRGGSDSDGDAPDAGAAGPAQPPPGARGQVQGGAARRLPRPKQQLEQYCQRHAPKCGVMGCGAHRVYRNPVELFCCRHRCAFCAQRSMYFAETQSCALHWLLEPSGVLAGVLWLSRAASRACATPFSPSAPAVAGPAATPSHVGAPPRCPTPAPATPGSDGGHLQTPAAAATAAAVSASPRGAPQVQQLQQQQPPLSASFDSIAARSAATAASWSRGGRPCVRPALDVLSEQYNHQELPLAQFADAVSALRVSSGTPPTQGAVFARLWARLGERTPPDIWAHVLSYAPPWQRGPAPRRLRPVSPAAGPATPAELAS